MTLDRLSLAALFAEMGPRVSGRRIEKVRPHGRQAIRMELSTRDALLLDVSRGLAGLWLLPRGFPLPADARDVEGPSRTATLLFKKHLEGARIDALTVTPGRVQGLATTRAAVFLRPSGVAGASLLVDGEAIAHFGGGERVFSIPADGFVDAAAGTLDAVRHAGPDRRREILATEDPGLQPLLRRWPVSSGGQTRLAEVCAGRGPAAPFLSPPPGDDAANAQTPPALLPFEPDGAAVRDADFIAASARLYVAARRADLFREHVQGRRVRAKAEVARLGRLAAALERDRGRWPDPERLRLQAEALLAAPPGLESPRAGGDPARGESVGLAVPDPRGGPAIEVRVDPRLTLAQNANLQYGRARSIERQQAAFEARWNEVAQRLDAAERELAAVLALRSIEDLDPASLSAPKAPAAAPKRYLTSRGLEILFGRSAAENHDVTFKSARREDLWFHVLDAPGGHVVLRNREGRANREDIAEAAALAAFLSERRTEGHVDVQYTEKKHVHPAGGGKGRVRVTHAEVIRVAPQDPAGRLRGRS